jgi:hypothetical protein
MEHVALTREMSSHAHMHRKNLCMVQIDFSNAFSSVPNDLILSNMTATGLPPTVTSLVQDFYTDNSSKIILPGGDTLLFRGEVVQFRGVPFLRRCSISVWKAS